MGRLKFNRRAWLAAAFGVVAQSLAHAQQTPPAPAGTPAAAPAPTPEGLPAVDIIPLRAFIGGVPLKNGNVVPSSEVVELNNSRLSPINDYAIDYVSGVIYLKVAQHAGDTLTVNYRTTGKSAGAASTSSPGGISGLSGLEYSFLPGAKAIFGMGMTDRADDGTVTSSNLYGWHNNLSFGGGGSLSGVYILASQQQAQIQNGLGLQGQGQSLQSENGNKSQFLVQNFKSSLMGGNMALDLQDVSKDFANFGSVRQSGYSDADVARLKAERGMRRTGLSFTGLKFGGLTLNNSLREVDDGRSHITWQTLGVQQKGLSFSYNQKKVDQTFTRFTDLSDTDKTDLANELGTTRQSFATAFDQKAGKVSFISQDIRDDMLRSGIHKTDLAFASKKYGFDFGRENEDQSFTRMGALTKDESAEFGHLSGLKKDWMTFSAAPDSKSAPLTFNQLDYSGGSGLFWRARRRLYRQDPEPSAPRHALHRRIHRLGGIAGC